MGSLFFELGRRLGHMAVPALRKGKWLWTSLSGSKEQALRAEAELGRTLAADLQRQLGPPLACAEAAWIADICRRLAGCVPDRQRQFQVELVRLDSPAILTLPGGYLFVDAGLLELCQRDPDQVAFLLSHEMAHVCAGHVLERLVAQVGFDALARLLSHTAASQWLRQTGLALLRTAYSLKCEAEADLQAARLMKAAGYSVDGAFRLLEALSQLRHSGTAVPPYFASHPPESARVARLRAGLKNLEQ